jgi:putative protease
MELVCPAGTPAALHAAIEAGADTVYLGFRNETNARNFPGLNFSVEEAEAGIAFAHENGRKVYVAINTYPRAGDIDLWCAAVDDAAGLGADAVIIADIGLLEYAANRHPGLRRHLSVQAAAAHPEAIKFFQREFGVRRVVLPRVLTVSDIAALTARIAVETEIFAYGGMCPMAEGRCTLSSYITGESPNTSGVCSPASHVRYEQREEWLVSRLGGFTINRFEPGEPAGYPTLCKGRFVAQGRASYLFEEPTSLDVAAMLRDIAAAGVSALKIEGRQRGRAYVAEVVGSFRRLLDNLDLAGTPSESEADALQRLAEGRRGTEGAYRKAWR